MATRQARHQTHLRIPAGGLVHDWIALSRDYDVIALDFPGFGGSAKLPANALPSAVALADAVRT